MNTRCPPGHSPPSWQLLGNVFVTSYLLYLFIGAGLFGLLLFIYIYTDYLYLFIRVIVYWGAGLFGVPMAMAPYTSFFKVFPNACILQFYYKD